jgi:hypothetical protein
MKFKSISEFLTRRSATAVMLILVMLIPLTLAAQWAWDEGSAGVSMGFPVPNESWNVSGQILDLEPPAQGVGGLEISIGDSSLLIAMAYDLYTTSTDTLADLLVCIIQDTVAIAPGQYPIAPLTGMGALLVWLPELNIETLLGLVDSDFSLDSLTTLNPYLGLTGNVTVITLDDDNLDLTFQASLLNTDLQFLTFQNGTLNASSNLPDIPYPLGIYTADDGIYFEEIAGELNPLSDDQGVGALQIADADTITSIFIAYWPDGAGDYQVHGLVIRDLADNYGNHPYQLSIPQAGVPSAFAFETPPLDLLALSGILAGSVPIDTLELAWYSVFSSPFYLEESPEALTASMNAQYLNLGGNMRDVQESWSLATSWSVVSTEPVTLAAPETPWVGAAFPNPFNNTFHLPIQLTQTQSVRIVLVDMLGRERLELKSAILSAGSHTLDFQIDDPTLSSGWYGCRIQRADGSVMVRPVLYLQ